MLLRDVPSLAPYRGEPWLVRLRDEFGVRHGEQLRDLLEAEESDEGLARLGVPVWELRSLPLTLPKVVRLPPPSKRPPLTPLRPADPPDTEVVAAATGRWPLPRQFWCSHWFPPAGDQGERETCVAFAAVTALELMSERLRAGWEPLSQECLYYLSKKEDGWPHVEGTTIRATLQAAQQDGVCSAALWPYVPTRGAIAAAPARAMADAQRHRISGWRSFALPADPEAIKQQLCSGRGVLVSVPVYRTAWFSSFARWRGDVLMPVATQEDGWRKVWDKVLGGQAVALVGYCDNEASEFPAYRPGGGYFGFANSWGTGWAADQETFPLPPGYGVLPYSYVRQYAFEACVIDGLLVDDKPRTPEDLFGPRPQPRSAAVGW